MFIGDMERFTIVIQQVILEWFLQVRVIMWYGVQVRLQLD